MKSAGLRTAMILAFAILVLPVIGSAQENDTATDAPVSVWDIGHWFMETTGYFMHNISEKGGEWFGIDPSIMMLFLLIVFLLAIRYKANGWMFWILMIVILFFVSSGLIPLGDYI